MCKGYLAGYQVIDMKATLFDGKYHDVDSSDMSFQLAGQLAFKNGMAEGNPIILEPICELDIFVPEMYTGAVVSDLNGRRGRVMGMETIGRGQQNIKAQVPQNEIQLYTAELSSLSNGNGYFKFEFDHYEIAPEQVKKKVLEKKARNEKE